MNGVQHYLWRAVDQRGVCLGLLVTRRRGTYAARKFLWKLLKSQEYTPRVMITDKLCSHEAAKRQVMALVEHRKSKYLNNRAENSRQRTRQREYAMRRFASLSPGHASRFCTPQDGSNPRRGEQVDNAVQCGAHAPGGWTSCRETVEKLDGIWRESGGNLEGIYGANSHVKWVSGRPPRTENAHF